MLNDQAAGSDRGDPSNGWEAAAASFIAHSRPSSIGVERIRTWAGSLPPGAVILDLGCGPGTPRSEVLASRGFALHAIDASPTLASTYQARFRNARVICEPVEDSSFFDETFDGVLAWGLIFLLPARAQRELVRRVAGVLRAGGRFLFTAPEQAGTWDDLSTGRQSLSLGADAYRTIIEGAGLILVAEYDDEGENHYYDAVRRSAAGDV
jgi:SAM-dependent methyltransferase